MSSNRSNSSLAVAAGGVFAYVILISGVWHPKTPAGGLTQVGRHASVAFEDGSVVEMSEPETDLDILRRRRMAGWNGHEYRQTFIMADGEEMEVTDNWLGSRQASELSSGSHLILAANSRLSDDNEVPPPLDGEKVTLAALKVDGKDRAVSEAIDGKDRVVEDVVDAKDHVYLDPKDAPVFALYNKKPTENPNFDLMGPDGMWGNLRTTTPLFSFPSGGSPTGGGGGGGTISDPPSGTSAVPEPSTLSVLGTVGVLAGAFGVWRRRKLA